MHCSRRHDNKYPNTTSITVPVDLIAWSQTPMCSYKGSRLYWFDRSGRSLASRPLNWGRRDVCLKTPLSRRFVGGIPISNRGWIPLGNQVKSLKNSFGKILLELFAEWLKAPSNQTVRRNKQTHFQTICTGSLQCTTRQMLRKFTIKINGITCKEFPLKQVVSYFYPWWRSKIGIETLEPRKQVRRSDLRSFKVIFTVENRKIQQNNST